MVTIRAPGGAPTVKTLPQSVDSRAVVISGVCPRCGMHYRYLDGVLYPMKHGDSHGLVHNSEKGSRRDKVCDACHLEEVMNNITARRSLHHNVNRTITKPSLKKQILIPERKQRLISSVSETMGGFVLSRQEIGTVIDLCNDVEITMELEQDAQENWRMADRSSMSVGDSSDAEGSYRIAEVLAGAHQRLVDYISNLGSDKRHDLYSMMLLGRNLDYYGLCQEAVVEFKLRSTSSPSENSYYSAEKIAKRRDLKNWIQLVLDLVEA